MRVLDDADHVPERIFDRRYFDSAANILHRLMHSRAHRRNSLKGGGAIFNTPIRDGANSLFSARTFGRLQAQLVTGNIKADVERLVEIRLNAEDFAVPLLAFFNVVYVIDGRA